MTPDPQSQPVQPTTTPPPPDLAATVADLLDLTTKLVLRSVEHANNFSTLCGWIAEHELRLRSIGGATSEAEATMPGMPSAEDAKHTDHELVAAIERLREQLSKDFDYHFNRVTARLDHL